MRRPFEPEIFLHRDQYHSVYDWSVLIYHYLALRDLSLDRRLIFSNSLLISGMIID